jgi:hypothetical protein
MQRIQVLLQLPSIEVGRRLARRMAHDLELIEAARGCSQARVDADQRAAIRLVQAMIRGIGGGGGQLLERAGCADQPRAERQLPTETVDLVEEEVQCMAGLHAHRLAQHLRGDERVAVPITADPASQPQERL